MKRPAGDEKTAVEKKLAGDEKPAVEKNRRLIKKAGRRWKAGKDPWLRKAG